MTVCWKLMISVVEMSSVCSGPLLTHMKFLSEMSKVASRLPDSSALAARGCLFYCEQKFDPHFPWSQVLHASVHKILHVVVYGE